MVDPADTAAPLVCISAPIDGSQITSPLDVTGTVIDPALSQYTLAYAPGGTDQWITLATGTAPVTDGAVGRFDPTVLANGLYDILLSAEDYNGNSANDTVTELVDGQMKVGVNKIGFTDLQVPVAGIDLTI